MRISDKNRRRLEISGNLAILAVAIILLRNLIWPSGQTRQELDVPTVGARVSLPGIQWDEGTTLLLVLQQGCRYCEASSAFYRRLHNERSGTQPRMIAVVPGDKAEIARYLASQGVIVDDIITEKLSGIKVPYTPTLLLVDRAGKVIEGWVGKLDKHQESEVAQRIATSK
jgi:hypothetical protein